MLQVHFWENGREGEKITYLAIEEAGDLGTMAFWALFVSFQDRCHRIIRREAVAQETL